MKPLNDIRVLRDEAFAPIRRHRQSMNVEGVCGACDAPIAPGEMHPYRSWLNGPADACQHEECPAPVVKRTEVYVVQHPVLPTFYLDVNALGITSDDMAQRLAAGMTRRVGEEDRFSVLKVTL